MLIDCERMLPLWNRAGRRPEGKHALIKKPAQTPGLWGPCDPHWNARDQEYVEGLTKCLHYTALHQQPWHPFPGDYSYHPNPLAYIWYGLEREADAAGYQVFDREPAEPRLRQAPECHRRYGRRGTSAGAGRSGFPARGGTSLDPAGQRRPQLARPRRRALRSGAPRPNIGPTARSTWWSSASCWSACRRLTFPGSLARRSPGPAGPCSFEVPATAASGLGSAEWWRRGSQSIAKAFPAVSWHLDFCRPRASRQPA